MKKILFTILISSSFLFGQSKSVWFPEELNIKPFTANLLEARAGFKFFTNQKNVQLDAGFSQDFYLKISNADESYSFGGDIFTFTRLREAENFHFPVEAVDYYFGINASYKNEQLKPVSFGIRTRIAHISAHLVDGRYIEDENIWMDNRDPQVYSREFIEFIPYLEYKKFRTYFGYTYMFHVIPTYISKSIFQLGFDYYYVGDVLPFIPFAAYDLKFSKITSYTSIHSVNLGVKFGNYNGKGFSILYSYNKGLSVHGEYFDLKEDYSAIGFNIDL